MAITILGTKRKTRDTVEGGGTITHGREILANGLNTGHEAIGVTRGSLEVVSAYTVSSTPGAVFTGKLFTNGLVLNGAGSRVTGCRFECQGENTIALEMNAADCIVEYTTITTAATDRSMYMCVRPSGARSIVRKCNMSRGENMVTVQGDGTIIEDSYIHECAQEDNPPGHPDAIECYGPYDTVGVLIQRNRIVTNPVINVTALVNIAPIGTNANNVWIQDNYLDGAQEILLVDNQGAGTVNGTRFLRNDCGGHQYGEYTWLQNSDGRAVVSSSAAQTSTPSAIWLGTGADANYWVDSADLIPNLTGTEVT